MILEIVECHNKYYNYSSLSYMSSIRCWQTVQFDEERLTMLQMRLGSSTANCEETARVQYTLSKEEVLERCYWGFQKLLNLLPPNNALSIGPQLNNDLV